MGARPSLASRHDDLTLLEAAVWAAELGAYEWDVIADRARWLNDWCQHHDIDPCDGPLHGVQWRANVHPEDRATSLKDFEAHWNGERDRFETEYRIRTKSGTWRWIRNRAYIVRSAATGAPERLLGVCLDINARRELAAELERSESNLKALAAAAPIWMMLFDAHGRIEFANRSVRGIEPASLVGRSMAEVISDPSEATVIEAFRESVIKARAPQMLTSLLPDGRSIGTWATPIFQDGRLTGVASASVDLSERRTRERDLLEAVTREQRRFGHDLHDGLGQELTGIALLVKTLQRRAEKEAPGLAADLAEVLDYVTGAIATSREVARGVSPVGREHGGLGRALADLAGRWPTDGGIEVSCRIDPRAGESLEALAAENIYRIAQESLSNAVRHASAKRVTLVLEYVEPTGGVRLSVEDDGCGIRADQMLAGGLGLKILRARAELLGATLRIGSAAPAGTRVECLYEPDAQAARRPRAAP